MPYASYALEPTELWKDLSAFRADLIDEHTDIWYSRHVSENISNVCIVQNIDGIGSTLRILCPWANWTLKDSTEGALPMNLVGWFCIHAVLYR